MQHTNMRTMFPAPMLAAEGDDEAEIRALFGIEDETTADGQDTESSNGEQSSSTETSAQQENTTSSEGTDSDTPEEKTTETPSPKTPTEDTPLDPEEKFINKQNSAFAQMRIQNKELSDLVMNLAKATGQTPKNIAEAQTMLNEGLTKVVSKNRNIPEDVLREMEEDKKKLAELTQTQAKQKAINGFQQVKDKFQLTRDEVNQFADKLIENKLNPFEQDLDLEKEYKNIYFDALIAKAKEEGVQEERARSLKAQTNSTTPSTQNGLSENAGTQKPIKTVKDLDELLDSLK